MKKLGRALMETHRSAQRTTGYECRGWDRASKYALANKILEHINSVYGPDRRGQRAYVEVDGLYPGVRIRRLTHYDEATQTAIIKDADRLFDQVEADMLRALQHE